MIRIAGARVHAEGVTLASIAKEDSAAKANSTYAAEKVAYAYSSASYNTGVDADEFVVGSVGQF